MSISYWEAVKALLGISTPEEERKPSEDTLMPTPPFPPSSLQQAALAQQAAVLGPNIGLHSHPPYGGIYGNRYSHSALYSSPAQAPGARNIGAAALASMARTDRAAEYPASSEGVRAGEVTGWRFWRVDRGVLRSAVKDTPWFPGQSVKGKPMEWGVHAFKGREQCLKEIGSYGTVAIGTVEMWGEIIEHEGGYRAEHGAIASLDEVLTETMTYLSRREWAAGGPAIRAMAGARNSSLAVEYDQRVDMYLIRSKQSDPELLAQLRETYGLANTVGQPP